MSRKQISKHENMSFRLWLDSLPVSNYPQVRQRILASCEVSPQVFRNWRAGLSAISPLAKKEIVNIAGKNVFDVELTTNGHQ
jgi:hypothetical protein